MQSVKQKEQLIQELEMMKTQNKALNQQIMSLRTTHQFTVLELAQSRQNQQKYKKLNDTLIKSLEANSQKLEPMKDIKLIIEGEFGCKNCLQLERQLDQYRSGVNASVERRVREISRNYSELEEQDKRKSRISTDKNSVHINYNVSSKRQCICSELEATLSDRDKILEELNSILEQAIADKEIISEKLMRTEALVDNLKRENSLLQSELSRLQYQFNYSKQDYPEERPSRLSYNTKNRPFPPTQGKENKMMRQITNLVSCLSNRKNNEERERGKSRILLAKDNSTLFSIKNGINRPANPNYYG